MSSPELSVVCKSCGSEVSPYVTECPYCGTRLRKRAPKLERQGDEIRARERRRARRRRVARGWSLAGPGGRAWATYAIILGSALMLLVQRAFDLRLDEVGALIGPVGSEWWRYLAAPFVYDDMGYLFVIAVALAIFAPPLEARLGSAPTLLLLVACGALGMLAADGVESLAYEGVPIAAGGNGIALGALAAWLALRQGDRRQGADEGYDLIGVAVCAVVLLVLPIFEDTANAVAGVGGALVGGAAGVIGTALGRGAEA